MLRNKRIASYGKLLLGMIVMLAVLAVCNMTLNSYYLRLINVLGINMILALSLNLTNGFCGTFSLGHAAFMALGAYASSLLTLPVAKKVAMIPDLPAWLQNTELPFIVALLIGGVISSFVAMLVGLCVLRLKGHYLTLATLGLVVIVHGVLVNMEKYTKGPRGLNGIPKHTNVWWIYMSVFVIFLILWRLTHSSFGRSLKAIREDETAAQSFGVNPFTTKLIAFCIGAFFAGFAGGLWAHNITAITPQAFYYSQTFDIVMMVILGGSGSLCGSLLGAGVITILPELLRSLENGAVIFGTQLPAMYGLSSILLSILMIVVLIFRPGGIMGQKEFSLSMLSFLKKGRKKDKAA